MFHGICISLRGELADPCAVIDIAHAAEESGWDGLFVSDHILRSDPSAPIADPWIVLAGIASVTHRIRLGPMVTPLPRRRVFKLARETVTLDRLSKGRLIVGLGSGSDKRREFSAFGEVSDASQRAQMLDEGARVLVSLWAEETVNHHGAIIVDNVRAHPGPLQQPRIPIWMGTKRTTGAPIERAAHYDGIYPWFGNEGGPADPTGVSRIADAVVATRGTLDGFDIAVIVNPDGDLDKLRAAGATWAMQRIGGARPDQVLQVIAKGKPF